MSLFAFSPCNRTAAYNLHVTRRCTRSAEMREAVSGAGRDCSLYSRVENTSRGIKFIAGHTKMSPHQSVITVVSKQARGNRKKAHRSTRNNRQGRGGYLIRRWCALFVFPPFSFLAWREELRVDLQRLFKYKKNALFAAFSVGLVCGVILTVLTNMLCCGKSRKEKEA